MNDRRRDPGERRIRTWERAAGTLSIVAGAIHGGVAPGHFAAWWGYGVFFVVAASVQVLFGLALLTGAVERETWGASWRNARRALYALGIGGTLAIILLYLVTRTIGVPVFGPEAGQVEPVGTVDVVSKVVEIALVLALLFLFVATRRVTAAAGPATPS